MSMMVTPAVPWKRYVRHIATPLLVLVVILSPFTVEKPETHRLPEQDNPLTGGSICISVQARCAWYQARCDGPKLVVHGPKSGVHGPKPGVQGLKPGMHGSKPENSRSCLLPPALSDVNWDAIAPSWDGHPQATRNASEQHENILSRDKAMFLGICLS